MFGGTRQFSSYAARMRIAEDVGVAESCIKKTLEKERESQMRKLTTMSIFFVSTVIAALLVSGTEAQSSPLVDLANCAELRKQFEFRKVRLFTNAQGTDGVQDVICLHEQLG